MNRKVLQELDCAGLAVTAALQPNGDPAPVGGLALKLEAAYFQRLLPLHTVVVSARQEIDAAALGLVAQGLRITGRPKSWPKLFCQGLNPTILLGPRPSRRRSMSSPAESVPTTLPRASALPLSLHFRQLRDPRREHRRLHLLLDLVVIALCAVVCGANTWPEVDTWAQRRAAWLRRFLSLPHGIPSHDTFERVFDRIDPGAFQACFRSWITAAWQALQLPHIAIDGKALHRSGSDRLGSLHIVSAWATANHLALGEVAVAEKSNEITAIPRLLDLLGGAGAVPALRPGGLGSGLGGPYGGGGVLPPGGPKGLFEAPHQLCELWAEWVFPHAEGGKALEKPLPPREIILSVRALAA
jgi:hypothetical protein